MKHSFIASLLLLCFLFSKASGIRLEKGFPLLTTQKQIEDNALTRTSSEDNNEVENTDCTDGQCKGSNRKLVTTAISRANTMSKTVKNVGHQDQSLLKENSIDDEKNGVGNEKTSKANFSSVSKKKNGVEIVHENYPDLTDIAEMDYSPARRKPPIHN